MRRKAFIKPAALLLAGCLLGGGTAAAYVPYDSYTYSTMKGVPQAVYSPAPFVPARHVDGAALGVALTRPVDMAFDAAGKLYIVDGERGAIVILNADFTLDREVTELSADDGPQTMNKPQGLYIADKDNIYLCDTDNSRILLVDGDFRIKEIFPAPASAVLGDGYEYKPRKIAVDASGTMYVVNANEYNGIMKLDRSGAFITFMGSNRAIVDFAELFWQRFMSQQQVENAINFLPIEYVNLSMDDSGFLYTVAASTAEQTPIKRLNLSGDDVTNRSGYVDIVGDIYGKADETSIFTDIVSDADGVYYALDSAKGRIFAYNGEGYLFYAFGGRGDQVGNFRLPSAIEAAGDRLLVLDELKASLTIFKKTDYAHTIARADSLYGRGQYEQSVNEWNAVLKLNSNFELAYAQIGKVLLRQKEYDRAMEYFELGNYRGDDVTGITGYNKAFVEYRKRWASRYLGYVLAALVLVMIAGRIHKRARKRRAEGRERGT